MNVADYISDTSGKDYYIVSREDLVSIADAIREKAGIEGSLVLPTGIVSATDNIVSDITINDMLTIGLPKISGNVIFTGTDLPFGAFAGNTGITSFTGNNMTKVFDGTIPAADGPGIDFVLTLGVTQISISKEE